MCVRACLCGSVRVSGAAPAGGSFATAAVTHGRRRSASTTRICSRRPRPMAGCSTLHACSTTPLTMCPPLRSAPLSSPRAPRPCGSLPHCAAPPFLRAATVFVRGRGSLKCALCPAPATWPLPPGPCPLGPCQLAPASWPLPPGPGGARLSQVRAVEVRAGASFSLQPGLSAHARTRAHTHKHVRTHARTHTHVRTRTHAHTHARTHARKRTHARPTRAWL